MQTPKARNGPLEVPKRACLGAVCQLKTTGLAIEPGTSNQPSKTASNRNLKVAERRSPRSPISEKRPSRISELESEVSHLEDELKKAKAELGSSESWKKQAQQDAEESKKQLSVMCLQLEESQKQLIEYVGSKESQVTEVKKKNSDPTRQFELEADQKQQSVNAALLTSLSKIGQLKVQLAVSKPEAAKKEAELAIAELQRTRESLIETLSLVENMQSQLKDGKEAEAQAQALASETLLQLETAKKSMEALKYEGMKAIEAYNSIASELDRSRARVISLEGLVSKLEVDLSKATGCITQAADSDNIVKQPETGASQTSGELKQLEEEISSLKDEVRRLRSALEAAERKYHEERIQSSLHIKKAQELEEQIKSRASKREAELMAELGEAKSNIEELKANLMDKETELQGISEENEALHFKLETKHSYEQEKELKNELCQLRESLADLKMNMMNKEKELQNMLEENEMLRLETAKREMDNSKMNENMAAEIEAARAAEQEALVKLRLAMEEADKSKRRAENVMEQLEAAQTTNSEIEGELRRLKVQSDQWRKAAEVAVAMLSAGYNGKFMERTGSMDGDLNSITGKINSSCSVDVDDDLLKKKNANMLKKIGMLWKKPQN